MKSKYEAKFKAAAIEHLEKNLKSLKQDDPGKAYASLKKMGAQPGDCSNDGSFVLSAHVEENLSTAESIERIAEHFAQISQLFPPFNPQLLSAHVRDKIEGPVNPNDLPKLLEHEVYQKISKAKKPKSSVPGDFPRRLVKEFGPELACPAMLIYSNIIKTGKWPNSWKVEYGSPLQKKT